MKINMTEEIREDSLLSHVVLHCITETVGLVVGKLAKEGQTDEGVVLDVELTVNNRKVNLKSFIDHWQKQVYRIIREKAEELVEERFNELEDLLSDLGDRIKSEIHQRLENWEKEEWEKENMI